MKVFAILATATFALAAPSALKERQVLLCAGLTGSPVCCATDVLGVADLNCNNPPSQPTSTGDFVDICAAIGQQAKCCAAPILGQALICDDVVA